MRTYSTNRGFVIMYEVAAVEECRYGVRIILKSGKEIYHNCKPSEVAEYIKGLHKLITQ